VSRRLRSVPPAARAPAARACSRRRRHKHRSPTGRPAPGGRG